MDTIFFFVFLFCFVLFLLNFFFSVWFPADRAKAIKTKAVVNESPTEKLIRELKEENQKLLEQLKMAGQPIVVPGEPQMVGISEEGKPNYWFMVSERPLSSGCMWEVAKRDRSTRVAAQGQS